MVSTSAWFVRHQRFQMRVHLWKPIDDAGDEEIFSSDWNSIEQHQKRILFVKRKDWCTNIPSCTMKRMGSSNEKARPFSKKNWRLKTAFKKRVSFFKGSECVMEPQNDISGWNYDLKIRLFTQLVLQNFPPHRTLIEQLGTAVSSVSKRALSHDHVERKIAIIHVQFRLHKISVPPFVLVGRPNILHSSKMNKTKCQNVLWKKLVKLMFCLGNGITAYYIAFMVMTSTSIL